MHKKRDMKSPSLAEGEMPINLSTNFSGAEVQLGLVDAGSNVLQELDPEPARKSTKLPALEELGEFKEKLSQLLGIIPYASPGEARAWLIALDLDVNRAANYLINGWPAPLRAALVVQADPAIDAASLRASKVPSSAHSSCFTSERKPSHWKSYTFPHWKSPGRRPCSPVPAIDMHPPSTAGPSHTPGHQGTVGAVVSPQSSFGLRVCSYSPTTLASPYDERGAFIKGLAPQSTAYIGGMKSRKNLDGKLVTLIERSKDEVRWNVQLVTPTSDSDTTDVLEVHPDKLWPEWGAALAPTGTPTPPSPPATPVTILPSTEMSAKARGKMRVASY